MIVTPGIHPSSRSPRSKGSRCTEAGSAELPGARIPTRGTRAGWPSAGQGWAAAIARPDRTARRPMTPGSLIPDPRVEVAVEEINPEVDEGEGQGDDQDAALDQREVAGQDPLDHEGAHPRPREDRLGQHGTAQEVPGLDAHDGGDRQQGVPEAVAHNDRALDDALGPRGADVVLAQHLEHARAREPRDDGG